MHSHAWAWIGGVDLHALTVARLTCHHAVQLLTHVARGYVPEQSDDSHTSLIWNQDIACWIGRLVETAATPFALALRPADLTLLVVNEHGPVDTQLPLNGLTLNAAGGWVEALLVKRGLSPEPFRRPLHFEIPAGAVAHGAPFELGDSLAFQELSRYYANAALIIEAVAQREPGSSPVRCWPHHFDIATLIPAGPSATIGYGMSPGDASYAQPYFYISPSPSPDPSRLPDLPAPAHWHTEGWTGAVLVSEAFVGLPTADAQQRLVEDFGNRTIALLRQLILTPRFT
jgi:hypothetical protein